MEGYILLSLLLVGICHGYSTPSPQPEQIHISFTGIPSEMMVTWTTMAYTPYSVVEYNKIMKPLDLRAVGTITNFTDGGSQHVVRYVHRVKLTGLIPGERYAYHCGGMDGWSSIFMFQAMKDSTDWSPRFALYGDLGVGNAKSLSYLQQEGQSSTIDAILHVGDFAYDMWVDQARLGDDFMNQIQAVAAYVPYMTCPGNHERSYNFSNYRNRFSMPGDTEGIFYSWNIGPAHIISISTEVYFWLEYGFQQIPNQYDWLVKDLQEAAAPENRTKRPWIIAMGHKPMYCSNNDKDDCTEYESIIRTGISNHHLFGLEDIFYKYGVDIYLGAHEHSYERLFPLYNRQICNGSVEAPYTNPCAPVHVITGSAGCVSKHDPFKPEHPPWTAFRTLDYGYTHMTIHNKSHIYFDQISVDKGGEVVDKFWLIKDTHGPEAWLKGKK